ncbi:hypothetical protein B7R22_15840 [Subtercola boreus]|uniref:ABC transporter ATP-binding protein n=1 Tax=Subtercola boreus TaxID=120213 RepID=A0A3E0VRT8_9MICO|nr:hypothetical protein [Subtercola boreus]RFA12280.1 hypothetical protein B7R22_15840 [Subtercola boreus]
MRITLNDVAKGDQGENLPPTSLEYQSGGVTVVAVETAQRPTVLALLASGRMAPDHGTVTIDDADDAPRVRSVTAIVDAPDVSEPVGDLKLKAVVQEELMFAGRPSSRAATAQALAELDATEFAGWEIQNIPTAVRLRILTELASVRPGIEALVLAAPDRRGSDPYDWWAVAADFALRGFAVLVIASPASADLLAEVAARFEAERLAELERRAAAARAEEAARLADLLEPPTPADTTEDTDPS